MFTKALPILAFLCLSLSALAQESYPIYSASNNAITGSWTGNGTYTEVKNSLTDNHQNLNFDYNVVSWWAGLGLNLDDWGSSLPMDFAQYDSLTITYKGIASAGTMRVLVSDAGATASDEVTINPSSTWTTVSIPITSFSTTSSVNLSNISELRFFSGSIASGAGVLEVSAILLKTSIVGSAPTISITTPTSGGSQTSNAAIAITASASDAGGNVERVDFYINKQLVGWDFTSPFTLDYLPQSNDTYEIFAVAIDNDENETQSSSVSYSVAYTGTFNNKSRTLSDSLVKGVNATNFLDAYWNMSVPGFPDESLYPERYLDTLQKLGINVLRLPAVFERFASNTYPYNLSTPHELYDIVDSMIEWTGERGMYLIIDNHHPDYPLNDTSWADAAVRTARVVKQVVEKYDYADASRVFFELRNEPHGIDAINVRRYFQDIIDTVRTINTTHTLMLGGSGYNSAYDVYRYSTYNDTNLIYTYHDYNPSNFTHQGFTWAGSQPTGVTFASVQSDFARTISDFAEVENWRDSLNTSVILGEFGVSTYADETSRCDYMDTMRIEAENRDLPWIYWGWQSADESDEDFGWFKSWAITIDSLIPCVYAALDFDTSGYVPLPVEWLSFDAKKQSDYVLLSWSTAIELNNDFFEIQRSNNGSFWETIGGMKGSGTTQTIQHYKFVDSDPKGLNYYRIKQIDYDGQSAFSEVKRVIFDKAWALFPNPTSGKISLPEGTSKLVVINAIGQTCYQSSMQDEADLSALPIGNYTALLTIDGRKSHHKLIIVR